MARAVKTKKKEWVRIVAPKHFNNFEIGESLCSDPRKLINKYLNVNLSELFNDPRKQNTVVMFKINDVKGAQADTEIVGYKILPAHVKRIVKKGRNIVDDSFVCETKDNAKLRVKPMMVTRGKTNKSVLSKLRKKTREFIFDYCKKKEAPAIFDVILSNQLQRDLKKDLKKTYPLSVCELRVVKRL